MPPVTHIHADSAHRAHKELIAALGTEAVPQQWMTFMATVRRHLPEILSRGRPSKAALEASIIGALGFNSWREMCEAPINQGGLGLPWSTWRQWSRAWTVISQYPSLEGAPLTAAEVNRIASEAKKLNEAMPGDMAAVKAFQGRQEARKQESKVATQVTLQKRVEALQERLSEAQIEVAQSTGVVEELRRQLASAQELRDQATRELDQALIDLRTVQSRYEEHQQNTEQRFQAQQQEIQALKREVQAYEHQSFLERLSRLFRG